MLKLGKKSSVDLLSGDEGWVIFKFSVPIILSYLLQQIYTISDAAICGQTLGVDDIAGVNDVFNAVLMQGDMLGDVVFYGKGAGKLPTASAVVADVIDALKDGSKIHDSLFWKPAEKLDHQLMDTAKYSYYIRTAGVPAAALPNVAGPGKLMFDYGDSAAYLIEAATAADLEAVAAKLKVLGGRLALVLKKLPE